MRPAELCILFLYHRVDEHTIRHFELVKRHNPSAAIVALTDGANEHLPDGVDLVDTPSRWSTQNKWASIDSALYRWFEHHRIPARRYVVFEYDVWCNQSVADAYREVWDADVACADLMLPWRTPSWRWFRSSSLRSLPPSQRRFAAGMVPFVGALYAHDALARIVEHVTTNDVFCELRLGTAARVAGLRIAQLPASLRRTLVWHPIDPDVTRPGIYHSVKPDPTTATAEHYRQRRTKLRALPSHALDSAGGFAIWAGAALKGHFSR